MLIKQPDDIPSRDITPKEAYLNRRTFLRRGAVLVGGIAATAGIYRVFNRRRAGSIVTDKLAIAADTSPDGLLSPDERVALGYDVNPAIDVKTDLEHIASYNNFYEFGIDKYGVKPKAKNFITKPWTLTVDGLCSSPRTFDLSDLQKAAPVEERVYRHRCTEGWSMVIPWLGYPLAALLSKVEPLSKAKYVAFRSYFDEKQMPDAEYLPWPYLEGLRMDEAMNPLALLTLGLYGQILLPQNGAPVRLVIPWKYGYKSAKSIVRITLTEDQPPTSWNNDQPGRYGFYSNVNPDFGPQSTEERIPSGEIRRTQIFNGYGAQVAHLYKDMDLTEYY